MEGRRDEIFSKAKEKSMTLSPIRINIKLSLFYLAIHVPWVVLAVIFVKNDHNAAFAVYIQFFALFMFAIGQYVFSFFLGLYFQIKYRMLIFQIILATIVAFGINLVIFWPLWKPNIFSFDLDAKYLFTQTFYQSLCFFVGSNLVKWIQNVRSRKTNNSN